VVVTVTTTVKSGGDKSPSSHTKLRLWPRRGDRRRCRQPPRLSTSFVDNTIDLPWRNFRSPEIGTTFQMEVLLVSDISEYPSNSLQCRIDGRKRVRAKTQLDPFSRFDTLRVHAQKLSVSLPYAVEWYLLMSRLVSYFSLTLLFTLCAWFVDYAFVIVVIKRILLLLLLLLLQYRLATDGQRDRQTDGLATTAYTALASRRAVIVKSYWHAEPRVAPTTFAFWSHGLTVSPWLQPAVDYLRFSA